MCEGHLLPSLTLEEPEAPRRKKEEEEEQEGEQAASCFPSLMRGPQPGGGWRWGNQEELSIDERQVLT